MVFVHVRPPEILFTWHSITKFIALMGLFTNSCGSFNFTCILFGICCPIWMNIYVSAIFIVPSIVALLSLFLLKKITDGKKYRNIILILACVGIGCFILALFIINYNDNDGSLFSNDLVALVQALLLWLTWLGALWAARESFDQKNIANKTIKEVRQQNDYEMRPYLRLMWAGDNSDDV